MIDLIVNIFCACLGLVLLFFVVLRGRRKNQAINGPLTINDFFPSHHLEFREAQQRLAEYNAVLREIGAKRRDTAIEFLEAIRGDFSRLQHLLTCATKFVPELTLESEAHRFWIGVRFGFEWKLARLQILLGFDSSSRLNSLTLKLQFLARRADKTLNEVARHYGLPTLESDLNS